MMFNPSLNRKRKRGGFTLLELIVVIGIMAVTTTIGSTIFFKMTTLWNGVKTKADLDAFADNVLDIMGRDMANVISADLSSESLKGIKSGNEAASDSIALPARIDPHNVLVSYRVDGNILKRTVKGIDDQSINQGIEFKKANVKLMHIEYLENGKEAIWRESWTNKELPAAVRVNLCLADEDRTYIQVARKAVFQINVR